ncbi:hypothetical protein SK571_40770 [Lentzea sp. BCCO 10_0798]|uniref:Uncharacterized protein n=1 Tax=Lentzea kristufekii TaxID=3095430 RepID=A0ABU4U5A1_9PSEU|nr:hypothetical protein [Lentzea sp. BCCO 10_0798]MDX8055748.1 hypothetical protein [Lentzea sp. BCCO 10_0798]
MSRNRTESVKYVGQFAINTDNHVTDLPKPRTQLLDLRTEFAQLLFRANVTAAVADERPSVRLDLNPSLFTQQTDAGHCRVDRYAVLRR